MDSEHYRIRIENGQDNFFSYTDRKSAYLMLHASDSSKSDGLKRCDEVIFTDFYLETDGKYISRTDCDSTELYEDCFVFNFVKYDIRVYGYLALGRGLLILKVENNTLLEGCITLVNRDKIIKKSKFKALCTYVYVSFDSERDYTEDELTAIIDEHKKYFEKINRHFDFDMGDPYINKALFWADINGSALYIKDRDDQGIWAGLPWFRQNWGRDTFIALPGLLLVNGFFDEARGVIASFVKHQNLDKTSCNYGRIPNIYRSNGKSIFNTADSNLYLIRDIWSYLLYTGDKEFIKEIWDNIQTAVFADLDLRCDRDGFLLNHDSDTWMDARINGKEPLSPRGNRSNEIQSLWYDALNIFMKLSCIMGSDKRISDIESTIIKLRSNFSRIFWNSKDKMLYDCIREDNTPDKKIRPNQLICINTYNHLLDKGKEEKLTINAADKLAFSYGVASLSPEDRDFHPYHDGCCRYHKDAAYHNGALWMWLSGPMISSLVRFNHQQEAYKITLSHCDMILKSGCLGTLSENADAVLTENGFIKESGAWSQAWSLAEFIRVFYQDYIGFNPDMINKKIFFNPKLPESLQSGYVVVFAGNNKVRVEWTPLCEGKRKFTFILEESDTDVISIVYTDPVNNKECIYILCADKSVTIDCVIVASKKKVKFTKLKKLSKYKCLRLDNYMFDKMTKLYQTKKIYEVC